MSWVDSKRLRRRADGDFYSTGEDAHRGAGKTFHRNTRALHADLVKWAKLVKESGAKLE